MRKVFFRSKCVQRQTLALLIINYASCYEWSIISCNKNNKNIAMFWWLGMVAKRYQMSTFNNCYRWRKKNKKNNSNKKQKRILLVAFRFQTSTAGSQSMVEGKQKPNIQMYGQRVLRCVYLIIKESNYDIKKKKWRRRAVWWTTFAIVPTS